MYVWYFEYKKVSFALIFCINTVHDFQINLYWNVKKLAVDNDLILSLVVLYRILINISCTLIENVFTEILTTVLKCHPALPFIRVIVSMYGCILLRGYVHENIIVNWILLKRVRFIMLLGMMIVSWNFSFLHA